MTRYDNMQLGSYGGQVSQRQDRPSRRNTRMKFATFNTNSVRTRLPILLEWLEKETPDILCLQETKVQDKDFPVEPLEKVGYHVTFRGQKSYNGVAILSKSPPEDGRLDLFSEGDDQARFIRVDIEGISVVNVYVPQGFQVGSEKFQYKLKWLKALLEYIVGHYTPGDSLIVAGDFNVAMEDRDVYDPEALRGGVGFHADEQALMKEFSHWGLEDVFRRHFPEGSHYTFWDYRIPNGFKRNLGWRIDYVLATAPLAEKSRTPWVDMWARALSKPSDHTFLVAEFDL